MCPVTGTVAAATAASAAAASGAAVGSMAMIPAVTAASGFAAMAPAAGFLGMSAGTQFALSLGINALSMGLDFMSKSAAADAQEEAQRQNFEATQDAANRAFENSIDMENRRLAEAGIAKSHEITANSIRAAQARATARVSAGESGVAGLNVDALMADFDRQESTFNEALRTNFEFESLASKDRVKAAAGSKQSRINSATPQPVSRPSFLGAAARVGGAAFNSFNKFSDKDESGRRTLRI